MRYLINNEVVTFETFQESINESLQALSEQDQEAASEYIEFHHNINVPVNGFNYKIEG
jgi:hypothetical protein